MSNENHLEHTLIRLGAAKTQAIQHTKYGIQLCDFKSRFFNQDGSELVGRSIKRLKTCGNFLHFKNYFTHKKIELATASFCEQHLICPLCAIRRGGLLVKRNLERFEQITKHGYLDKKQVWHEPSELSPFLCTFTVKADHDLSRVFEHLCASLDVLFARRRRSLQKQCRHKSQLKGVMAGIVSIELAYNPLWGWKPHAHCLFLFRPDLISDFPYELRPSGKCPKCESDFNTPNSACETHRILWGRYNSAAKKSALSSEWNNITGDSFIVDMRPFNTENPKKSFFEIHKYIVKYSALNSAQVWEMFLVLKNTRRRLVRTIGDFRGIESEKSLWEEIKKNEDPPFHDMFFRFFEYAYRETTMVNAASSKDLSKVDSTFQDWDISSEIKTPIFQDSEMPY